MKQRGISECMMSSLKGEGCARFSNTWEMSTEVAGTLITETQFFRHAKELAKEIDPSQFDGVVCVSGDGVLVEVCFRSARHSLPTELVSCVAFILLGIPFHIIY